MLSALPRGGGAWTEAPRRHPHRRWEVALHAGNISRPPLLVQTERARRPRPVSPTTWMKLGA